MAKPLSWQIKACERLAQIGPAALKKEGMRQSEIDAIIEAARDAADTLRNVQALEKAMAAEKLAREGAP